VEAIAERTTGLLLDRIDGLDGGEPTRLVIAPTLVRRAGAPDRNDKGGYQRHTLLRSLSVYGCINADREEPLVSRKTLSLTDIAALAGVQRPVVSMWRRRPIVSGQVLPFPDAAESVGGLERFDLGDVVDYLVATGRGRNPEAALDAPAMATPEAVAVEELIVLLTLRHLSGEDLADQDLSELAGAVDSRDELLRGEVGALGEVDTSYVDELYAAAYGPADALERLLTTRAGRLERRDQLTPEGVSLLAPLVLSLMVNAGEGCVLRDASGGSMTAVLQLASATRAVTQVNGPGVEARSARRIAALRGLDGAGQHETPRLRVDSLIGVDIEEALNRVDDMCLQLAPGEIGLLVGPAGTLTDRLTSAAEDTFRDSNIRAGHLRAAVRLPRRMIVGAPRQALAIWLVAGAPEVDRPVAVADLGDADALELDAVDLGNDLVAAAVSPRGHHFRYLVGRQPASVVAGRTLVDRGLRAMLPKLAPDASVQLREHVNSVASSMPTIQLVESPVPTHPRITATLSELRSRGELTVKRGARLDIGWADVDGTVEVVDVDGWRGVRFDALDLEDRAPHATRTEPGDIVFTTNPPTARVEQRGGRLVPTPARVIRLSEAAPLGPHTLAHQLNRLPSSARDVGAWRIDLSGDPALECRLAALDELRDDLHRRLASADAIAHLLIDGTTTGITIQIDPAPSTDRND